MSEFYTNVSMSRGRLLVRGYSDDAPFRRTVDYKPSHYVPCRDQSLATHRSVDGKSLARVEFASINEARDYLKKYEDVENYEVYGFRRYIYPFIYENYHDVEYDFDRLSVVFFDIEVAADQGFPEPEYADKPVNAISIKKSGHTFVLGTVDYVEHRDDITYIRCRDERELLYRFIDVWQKLDPDIISGWNIEFFDIPYLVNRITEVCGESVARQMSPWMQLREYTQKTKWGNEVSSYELVGITTVDMMVAYRKFSFKNQESFSLNHIASVELGEKKIDYSEYDSLFDLYLKDPQKFIEYNVLDSDLVERIANKTGLIRQIVALAYDARVNYADAFTSVLLWEVIISNHLMDEKIAVPAGTKRNHKNNPIMGAFVKEPQVGRHGWVVGLDLDSLYPHLIMQYNISPETLHQTIRSMRNALTIEDILKDEEGGSIDLTGVEEIMKADNCGYTPNGCFFRNDRRGFLPALMEEMYSDRKRYKKLMIEAKKKNEAGGTKELEALITQYNNLQMAKKICLNSAYGALSNVYFMFYDIDLAEAITYAGQLAIKWIARDLNHYLNSALGTKGKDYVVASDTDSAYLTLQGLVDAVYPSGTSPEKIVEFLNKVCTEKINPFIEFSYDRLKVATNAYEQKMSMKVESVSESGIWKAKKRYALKMWWDEGVFYEKPKLKIKGMEAVQSSTPSICRDSIKDSLLLILDNDKLGLYATVDRFETQFKAAPFESIAYTSSISDIDKYHDDSTIYSKGAQAHIRGALIYNHNVKKLKLDMEYRRINNGDKIKTCYLMEPNPLNDNVVSVYNKLPDEFGVRKFVDYDLQFEKEFIKPVNDIAKLVGWDVKNRATLESFFG